MVVRAARVALRGVNGIIEGRSVPGRSRLRLRDGPGETSGGFVAHTLTNPPFVA